jgi:hypothetical protein
MPSNNRCSSSKSNNMHTCTVGENKTFNVERGGTYIKPLGFRMLKKLNFQIRFNGAG